MAFLLFSQTFMVRIAVGTATKKISRNYACNHSYMQSHLHDFLFFFFFQNIHNNLLTKKT